MLTQSIPNKFQALIEAQDIRCYTERERIGKSITLSDGHIYDILLPAIVDSADVHVAQREQSIRRRAANTTSSLVVEALFDPHFRKQRRYGPTKEAVAKKVARALAHKEPLRLVALMFTRKNVCTLKRNGDDVAIVDLAEIVSLVHLNSFAKLLDRLYPYGVEYYILSEGMRFLRAFDLTSERVSLYQARLSGWVECLHLSYLKMVDYEQFLADRLDQKAWEERIVAYESALSQYRELMDPLFDVNDMLGALAGAVHRDPVIDARNPRNNFVPLWDSIKHSLPYPEIAILARDRSVEHAELYRELFRDLFRKREDVEEESLRQLILRRSWDAAIEHNARVLGDVTAGIDVAQLLSDAAFRTTINPKPDSPNLGIYSVRETTSRVQPWHGTAYLRADGERRLLPTVLSKLEIEARGGVPVCVRSPHEEPFFYVDPQAVNLVQSSSPRFNMSTR